MTKENARPTQGRTSAHGHAHFTGIDVLLSRLEKVKKTGSSRWIACCPAHDDRSPSLAVRELDDGRLLLHCFGGCDVQQIVAAIGLDISDLFPPRETTHQARPERRTFPAADILRCIAFEALVVMTAGAALLDGRPFKRADRDRLALAVGRIQIAVDVAGVRQ